MLKMRWFILIPADMKFSVIDRCTNCNYHIHEVKLATVSELTDYGFSKLFQDLITEGS